MRGTTLPRFGLQRQKKRPVRPAEPPAGSPGPPAARSASRGSVLDLDSGLHAVAPDRQEGLLAAVAEGPDVLLEGGAVATISTTVPAGVSAVSTASLRTGWGQRIPVQSIRITLGPTGAPLFGPCRARAAAQQGRSRSPGRAVETIRTCLTGVKRARGGDVSSTSRPPPR